MSEYTLVLADGSTIQADVDGEISKWVRDLLTSGRKVRVQSDGKDVSGHAMSDAVGVIIYGDDDTEGHALTLRLPNAEAAKDLQRKLLATGALVGVIAVSAGVAQVAPNLMTGQASDAGASAVSRSISWDEAHAQSRANPSVAATRAADFDAAHHTAPGVAAASGSTWDLTHDGPGNPPAAAAASSSSWDLTHDGPGNPAAIANAPAGANVGDGAKAAPGVGAAKAGDTTSAVIGGAVNPGQTRDHLRTGSNPVVPPASANPAVRDGQADMAPIGQAAVGSSAVAGNDARHDVGTSVAPASTVDPTGGTVRGYDAAAVPVTGTAVTPPASANPAVRDGQADMAGKQADDIVAPASANPAVRDGQADMAATAAATGAGYGGGAAREAFIAEHGTTNPVVAASTAAANDARHDVGATAVAGASTVDPTGGTVRGYDAAAVPTAGTSTQAGDTDRAYAVHAAASSISGKQADDAALATASASGKTIDDQTLTSSASMAGKDADDQTLATAGNDDPSSPTTQANEWHGR